MKKQSKTISIDTLTAGMLKSFSDMDAHDRVKVAQEWWPHAYFEFAGENVKCAYYTPDEAPWFVLN